MTEERQMTYDERQRTKTDSKRSHEWLSYAVELDVYNNNPK